MNTKQFLGASLAVVFSSLMMACASEATTSEEETQEAEQDVQEETVGTTQASAPRVYCHELRVYDPSYCHSKSTLVSRADHICTNEGYRITQIEGYDTRFCTAPKAGAVTYRCCDEG